MHSSLDDVEFLIRSSNRPSTGTLEGVLESHIVDHVRDDPELRESAQVLLKSDRARYSMVSRDEVMLAVSRGDMINPELIHGNLDSY